MYRKLINISIPNIWLLILFVIFYRQIAWAAPEQKEATRLQISISTANNVNPDEKLRPNPIEIRIYELKSAQVFENSDFFSLQNKDKEILGSDMLVKDVLVLRPGEQHKIERQSDNETTALGILAGYRDLGKSQWRLIERLPEAPAAAWYRMVIPSNKLTLQIIAEERSIKIVPPSK